MSSNPNSRWFDPLMTPFTRRTAKKAGVTQVDEPPSPVNTTGLSILPTEILLEVISYIPSFPVPCEMVRTVFAKEYLTQRHTLRSLSQTCQHLRRCTLPILWDRIEACASTRIEKDVEDINPELADPEKKKWREEVMMDLSRQLEIVTVQDPSLARHVRIVSVVLTKYRTRSILKQLIRSLARFPNLHTIQFLGIGEGVSKRTVASAFKGRNFPTVRTLTVTNYSRFAIQSCPNTILLVSLPDPWIRAKVVTEAAQHLKNLQELRGVMDTNFQSFMYGNYYNAMESFVKLQVLTYDLTPCSIGLAMVYSISSFPDLRKAIFRVNHLPLKGRRLSVNEQTLVTQGVASMKEIAPVEGVKRQVILEDPSRAQLVYFEVLHHS